MSNYNGARRKTTVENRNANSQPSKTGAKGTKYFNQNHGNDVWGNAGRNALRSNSDNGRGSSKYNSNNGWGEINRMPSIGTSDDLWGPLPSQPVIPENAWDKRGSKKQQKFHSNQGKKQVPLVGPNFSWNDEDYPALESRPPVENFWEKRKEKLEGRKAMEPTNVTEEELMIKKAIELSKREAKEEEERRRLIEEEYELQNLILATYPQNFSNFLTPDELVEATNSDSEYQCNSIMNGYDEKESIWNCPEPVESPQEQIIKIGKKTKRNKSRSTNKEYKIISKNEQLDNTKIGEDKQNESTFPEPIGFQETQDNWSQDKPTLPQAIEYQETQDNWSQDEPTLPQAIEYQETQDNWSQDEPTLPQAIEYKETQENSSQNEPFIPQQKGYQETQDNWSQNESTLPQAIEYQETQNIWSQNESNISQQKGYQETQDSWSQNESTLPQPIEYQKNQDNRSQNSISQKIYNKADKNESEIVDAGSDYPSSKCILTKSTENNNESKLHKGLQPKPSKVIDIFGGWGSNNTQNSSMKPVCGQERLKCYDNHSSANSVSNNEDMFEDNRKKTKKVSEPDENLQFPKTSKCKEVKFLSKNEKDQSPLNEEDSWNNKYFSNDAQCSDALKHSLYSHVKSSISTPAPSSFCNAATTSSDNGDSYLFQKYVPKDDSTVNSIVQDYARLAVKCPDLSTKENRPVQSTKRKSTDIFSNVATLMNEDNQKSDIINSRHYSSVSELENSSIFVSNQPSKNEIMYTLNNASPAEFTTKAENESVTWNDSKIGFPTISESNDGLFLPHVNESTLDICNDPANATILPPFQPELNFHCQPTPEMPNLMNPSLIMDMNQLAMQQMMMLKNPFFLQQLHQMEMYYRTMSMPFASPLIPPMQMPFLNPMGNVPNPIGMGFNGKPYGNMNPVAEQSGEINQSIPPPCYEFENVNQRCMPAKTSAAPSAEFENTWLSGLLSEGAAQNDSYIPPPKMPVSDPSPNADMNTAQDILQSDQGNDTHNICDMKSLKQENSALKQGRTDINAKTENVNINSVSKSLVPGAVEASGWGNFDDIPKKNYNSWNNDLDGWEDAKITTSKAMINSSIYASHKQATIRQPRQTSKW